MYDPQSNRYFCDRCGEQIPEERVTRAFMSKTTPSCCSTRCRNAAGTARYRERQLHAADVTGARYDMRAVGGRS